MRTSDWLFIPASSAIELLVAVDHIECEASDVTAFVASEDGPDSAAEESGGRASGADRPKGMAR